MGIDELNREPGRRILNLKHTLLTSMVPCVLAFCLAFSRRIGRTAKHYMLMKKNKKLGRMNGIVCQSKLF
jgi:hypothetical protein